MPDTTKTAADPEPVAQPVTDDTQVTERIAAMVAAQAPRLFAAVATKHDSTTSEVVGWGMEFDDSAYMVTTDGKSRYALGDAESALRYIGSEPDIDRHLVWIAPAVLKSHE